MVDEKVQEAITQAVKQVLAQSSEATQTVAIPSVMSEIWGHLWSVIVFGAALIPALAISIALMWALLWVLNSTAFRKLGFTDDLGSMVEKWKTEGKPFNGQLALAMAVRSGSVIVGTVLFTTAIVSLPHL